MLRSGNGLYVDSSGLVKLAVQEPESAALRGFLGESPLYSCELVRVEVIRAVRRQTQSAVVLAHAVLQRVHMLALNRQLLERAATLAPDGVRSLDAIHIAAALTLAPALASLVTYDSRMIAAAAHHGLTVTSPAPQGPPAR